jgi:hypothetical protein
MRFVWRFKWVQLVVGAEGLLNFGKLNALSCMVINSAISLLTKLTRNSALREALSPTSSYSVIALEPNLNIVAGVELRDSHLLSTTDEVEMIEDQ